MRGKKRFLVMFCVLMLAAGLAAGCGKSGDEGNTSSDTKDTEKNVVKIGYSSGSLCGVSIHLAEINGYFEEEFAKSDSGYELVEIDATQIAELIGSKKVDAFCALSANMIQPMENGLDIAFTNGIHSGCTKYYVKGDSKIESVADLKGKKVGVVGLSDTSTINLKRKLQSLDINPEEVEFVTYNMPDLATALDNGAVDAVAMHDPVAYQSETSYGFKKIMDTSIDEKFKDEYCCIGLVTNALAKEHPTAAAAYTRAVMKACAFIQAQPEEAAKLQIEKGYISGEADTNAKLLASYNFSPSSSRVENDLRNAITELQGTGDVKADLDVDSFVAEHIAKLDDVPESYTYDPDTGEFTEEK